MLCSNFDIINTTIHEPNNNLEKVNKWAYQWKMSFNSAPNKQSQEVISSRKLNKGNHPPLGFHNDNVSEANLQKYLGVIFNNSLSIDEHLKMITNKESKTIGPLGKFHKALRRSHQLTIYKAFVRPRLDYDATVHDKDDNIRFLSETGTNAIPCMSCNDKRNRRHVVGVYIIGSGVPSAPSLAQKATRLS